ncbi:hypothetical protein ACP70R_034836 [Stipagrostis hirtigluma subsp. patula]
MGRCKNAAAAAMTPATARVALLVVATALLLTAVAGARPLSDPRSPPVLPHAPAADLGVMKRVVPSGPNSMTSDPPPPPPSPPADAAWLPRPRKPIPPSGPSNGVYIEPPPSR